jgi:hypothetical protein
MIGVQIGTLYKLLGSTINDGCNSFVVLEGRNEEGKTLIIPAEMTMLWHKRLGHIGGKGIQTLHGKCMVEGIFECSLDFNFY